MDFLDWRTEDKGQRTKNQGGRTKEIGQSKGEE
jgi:hypothetical protein